MSESNLDPRRPEGWLEATKRIDKLERQGLELLKFAQGAHGDPELASKVRGNVAAVKEQRLPAADWLRRVRPVSASRRPASRAAAHRPARRLTRTGSSSSTAGADPPPGDEPDEPEPGTPGLTFERLRELTHELAPHERLALALALPALEETLWTDLGDRCAAETERQLAEARA